MDEKALKRAAALFILKATEKHKLPLSAIDSILMDVQHLLDTVMERVNIKAMETLCAEDASSLSAILKSEDVANPFAGLQTLHHRTKYYKEYLGLIVNLYPFLSSLSLLFPPSLLLPPLFLVKL